MDLNRIFREFKKGMGAEDRQYNVGILNDNPIVLIGMFKKIIVNNTFFNKKSKFKYYPIINNLYNNLINY